MSEKKENPKQLNIELGEDVAEGIYSNLAVVGHLNSEFVVDFIKIIHGTPKAKVKSRIILTPQNAKRLLRALKDNISKFESNFGEIRDQDNPSPIPMNFGPPAQA